MVDAFVGPSVMALLPGLVSESQLPAANSILESIIVMSGILGPAAGSFLIAKWGVGPALFLDFVSFLFAIVSVHRIPGELLHRSAAIPMKISQLLSEGIRTTWNDAQLRSLCMLIAGLNFCTVGPLDVGIAVMAKARCSSATTFGLLVCVLGAGTLLGTLLGGVKKLTISNSAVLSSLAMALAIELTLLGAVRNRWEVFFVLGLVGVGTGFVNVQILYWLQMHVPGRMLGRVMSIVLFLSAGLSPFSLALSGLLVERHIDAMFFCSGGILFFISIAGTASLANTAPGKRR